VTRYGLSGEARCPVNAAGYAGMMAPNIRKQGRPLMSGGEVGALVKWSPSRMGRGGPFMQPSLTAPGGGDPYKDRHPGPFPTGEIRRIGAETIAAIEEGRI